MNGSAAKKVKKAKDVGVYPEDEEADEEDFVVSTAQKEELADKIQKTDGGTLQKAIEIIQQTTQLGAVSLLFSSFSSYCPPFPQFIDTLLNGYEYQLTHRMAVKSSSISNLFPSLLWSNCTTSSANPPRGSLVLVKPQQWARSQVANPVRRESPWMSKPKRSESGRWKLSCRASAVVGRLWASVEVERTKERTARVARRRIVMRSRVWVRV